MNSNNTNLPPKRRRLNKKEAESLLPVIREFNKLAKAFLSILTKKVEDKERRIAVMVSTITIPEKKYQINIQTIDIKNTQVTKKGQFSSNQKMAWEDDVMRNLRRGQVI
jgi:hypothetical protein